MFAYEDVVEGPLWVSIPKQENETSLQFSNTCARQENKHKKAKECQLVFNLKQSNEKFAGFFTLWLPHVRNQHHKKEFSYFHNPLPST